MSNFNYLPAPPGKIKQVEVDNTALSMFILNKSNMDFNNWRNWSPLRSCVYDDEGRVISVAPPTSYPRGNRTKMDAFNAERIEEFIDGTMINLFWKNKWMISTKSCIGGSNSFNLDKDGQAISFGEMFDEVINNDRDLFTSELDKVRLKHPTCSVSFSFVIQHTANRIISPVEKNTIYLVACYCISKTDASIYALSATDLSELASHMPDFVRRPKIYDESETSHILEQMYMNKLPFSFKGVVKYHSGGFYKEKAINPNYKIVERLKGNCPGVVAMKSKASKEKKLNDLNAFFPELFG